MEGNRIIRVIALYAVDELAVSVFLNVFLKGQRVGRGWTLIIWVDAEACQIVFDPEKVSYRTLIEYFYKMHDPTTANRQGPDSGSQYRSGIFYHSEEQKKVAEEVTKKVNEQWWKGGVVTELLEAGQWWDAEKYHQLYLQNNPGGYECPSQ